MLAAWSALRGLLIVAYSFDLSKVPVRANYVLAYGVPNVTDPYLAPCDLHNTSLIQHAVLFSD